MPMSQAVLQLLHRLALTCMEEAAAVLQHQQPNAASMQATPRRIGGRRMLGEDHSLSSGTEALYIIICVLLVVFSGMMAGLTLGLLSLDKVDLEVIKRSGTPKDVWLVEQVEPVLKRTHYLLATLLLCSAAAMETLPIFLDRLLNPVAAILISVTAILICGEIIPQAVCKRYGLQVGAYLAWPVRFLMLVTGPITWPIGKLLDGILGEETALFRRQEFKALVDIHAEEQEGDEMATLTIDEVQVIQGALDMATKTAESAMTPIEKVSMLSADAIIDLDLLHAVINAGHSRLPVYSGDKQNILGLILVKELVLVDENAGVKVKDLRVREVPFIRSDIPMYDVLKIFRMGRSHMAFLTWVNSALAEGGSHRGDGSGAGNSSSGEGAGRADGNSNAPVGLLARGSIAALRPFARLVGGGSDKEEPAAAQGTAEASGGTASEAMPQRPSITGLAGLNRVFFKPSLSAAAEAQQPPEEVIGIITIEDVLEELLQAEILDETDRFVDNMQLIEATRLLTVQHLPPHLRRYLTRSLAAGGTPGSRRSRGGGTPAAWGPTGGATFGSPAVAGTDGSGKPPAGVVAPPRSPQPLPRSAPAASVGAAATATTIAVTSVLGTSNLPVLGAAVAAGTVTAGQLSTAQGQHPVTALPSVLPGTSNAAPVAAAPRRPPTAAGAPSACRTVPSRLPPANIPRRGGSNVSLATSATQEQELGAASSPQTDGGQAACLRTGTSPAPP